MPIDLLNAAQHFLMLVLAIILILGIMIELALFITRDLRRK